MAKTALYTHPIFLEHDTGAGHPERADRLRHLLASLRKAPWAQALEWREPRPCALHTISETHSASHVAAMQAASARAQREDRIIYLDKDTPVSARSFEAAHLASSALLEAVDAVQSGSIQNAFCAVRPPGHHAERERAMGFCLFNHVAVATHRLRSVHGLRRVAIIDWDVHHGNGTQAIFDADPEVFFASTHQFPFYPGTGASHERGTGNAAGTKLNLPLRAGADEAAILAAFDQTLLPALRAFRPEFILISAGFDAHTADPLAEIRLTGSSYRKLTDRLTRAARELCGGKLVSTLEGGYDLDALAESVSEHLQGLIAAP